MKGSAVKFPAGPFVFSSFDLTNWSRHGRFHPMSYYETIINERVMQRVMFGEYGPVAWHNISIITCSEADAAVVVTEETNDDNDDGYPDGHVTRWDYTARTVEDALKRAGKCRVGISGVIVTVTLDGKEIR